MAEADVVTAKCVNCGQVVVHRSNVMGQPGWTHTFINYEGASEARYRMACTPSGRQWADPEFGQRKLL